MNYRHELESDIEPFKGLLLGIFFISIGASLNFTLISENLLTIVGITGGLIVLKFVILLVLGKLFKMENGNTKFFALSLAQGGEFGICSIYFCEHKWSFRENNNRTNNRSCCNIYVFSSNLL